MNRPLVHRLREVADRLDLIGEDGDRETIEEAIAVIEERQREAAETAQSELPIDAPTSAESSAGAAPTTSTSGRSIPPFAAGSETSRAAALSVYPRVGTDKRRIIDCLYATHRRRDNAHPSGLTRDQLALALALSPNTVRPRVVELMEEQWIVDSGRRRPSEAGHDSEVLVLSAVALRLAPWEAPAV